MSAEAELYVSVESTSPSTYKASGGQPLLAWRKAKSYKIEGAEHSAQFKKGNWDGRYYPGYRCTFDKDGSPVLYFRAGLLPTLKAAFPNLQVSESHVPVTQPSLAGLLSSTPYPIRDYQTESLAKMMVHRWGRIALATNAGKGAIIGLFAAACEKAGLRTLILCDQLAVFQALEEEVVGWGGDLSTVKAGEPKPPPGLTTLAMVPTLYRRVKASEWDLWLAGVDVLLMDEADRALSNSWLAVMKACPNSYWRFGFSGTFPETGIENLKLEEEIGPILIRVKNKDLVDREISARPTVTFLPFHHDLGRRRPEGWSEFEGAEQRNWIYEQAIIDNHERDRFIEGRLDPGGKNVIIVRRIAHGEALAGRIEGSTFLSGSATERTRDEVVEAWRGGEFHTLIVSSIMDRGTNRLGWATKVIMASGEGSDAQTLQRIGRGLRRSGGKAFVEFEDVMDFGHGYLDRPTKRRVKLYNQEEFDIRISNACQTG
jgi:superfamily II DNA or RNA helicase